MAEANQIRLKGLYGRQLEAAAGGTITPGHLLEIDSAGDFIVHNTAGAQAERLFALEDALQGNGIGDDYTSTAPADKVQAYLAQPGDEIQAWLAATENVAIGALLISAGDGTLMEALGTHSDAYQEYPVAVATEALDLTATGAVATRINVRVL
jgi:hypothetical protein